ncbi:hypothetical protein I2485_15150 [Nesterenkonia sp. E16_7]|uniref:hypothetical protein n=1 Tax=unclassified Nesterenkonia TaxID=2629769 RepID=UPI001A936703|nr:MULTISPECIES: hypothetical protein [unclassified Nesterenkonia]MBO0596287.1 hypothetical protein [Nesterenkonia sp. E16_10]MBO0599987.1 hypothetical protein [Nesterenkonia sp. E16_7]
MVIQDSRELDVHGVAAIGIHISSAALALALALVLRAWGIKTGVVPAITAVALFGLTFLQALLGSAMTLTFHVSGALVLTVMATWLTVWVFSRQRHNDAPRSLQLRSRYPEGAHS